MRIPPRQENLAVAKIKRINNGAGAHGYLRLAENRDDLPDCHIQPRPFGVFHRRKHHPKRIELRACIRRVEHLRAGYGVLLRKPGSERAPLPLSEIQRRDSLTPNRGGKIGLGETGLTAAGLSLSTVFVCVDDSLSDCSSCVCVPIGFWALPTVPKNMDVAMTNDFSPNCFI